MTCRFFSKYLYGWLRACLTICLAVVLVLMALALNLAEADAIPGAVQNRSTEITYLYFWLNPGADDYISGTAESGVEVTIAINDVEMATADSDPISGEWSLDNPIKIDPGDEVTVTAGAGLEPVVILIPDPLYVQADSLTDEVWGQVGGRSEESVALHPHWGDPGEETTTDTDGNFNVTFGDIPYGGEGNLYYDFEQGGTTVDMNVYFRTPDLVLKVHTNYEWVEGNYEPGHTVSITVLEGDKTTVKATTEVSTGPLEEWGGASGFATWQEDVEWIPEAPDIQAGDWIQGVVDVDSPYTAEVRVGEPTGTLEVGGDSISGTLDADWLMPGPVDIMCSIWEENGPEAKFDQITPNGSDSYSCNWSGEWDIVPGQHVQVSYFDTAHHEILREFHDPAPYLRIEKYYIGDGSPGVGGNAAFSVQYQNQGDLTAENVTITDTLVGMTYLSDTSGFTADVLPGGQELSWDLGPLEPGDWIGFVLFTEVTGAEDDPWSNTVEITTTSFDMGDTSEKISIQEGTIAGNDTHLTVSKDTWTWNPAPGEDYIYQITVCNEGSTGSSALSLLDIIPDLVSYVTYWSWDVGWWIIGNIDDTYVWDHPCISPHTCNQVYLQVHLDETAQPGDELINRVEIEADNDIETEDNFAELHHNVGEPYVDLAVWLDWHGGSLVPGGEYRYGITFKNDGNVGVDGPIEVTATLPEGVSFVSWDYWESGWAIPEPTIVDHVITWEIHDMLPGTQGTIELWLQIDASMTPGTILEHLAEIEIQDGEENTDNNVNKLKVMVNPHGPNLRIWKYGWEQGDHVGYYIHVENVGDETVEDVSIIDDYSDLLQLEGGINIGYDQPWDWADDDPEQGAFTVTLDRLEPGWGADIEYTMLILGAEPLEPGIIFENTAEILPIEGDINPDDNLATWVLGTGPDLFVEKTLEEGVFEPGKQVTYRLEFGNKHNDGGWWWDMQGHIILTDVLPDGMHFVSAYLHHCGEEVWGGVETSARGQAPTWSLYPEGSDFCYELLLTVEIGSEVAFTNPLINQATVASSKPEVDIDPFPDNNTSFYDPGRRVFDLYMPLVFR